MALGDVLGALEPKTARKKSETPKKYVSFEFKEWQEMEAAAGKSLETSAVKALIQGIFNGQFNVTQKKG